MAVTLKCMHKIRKSPFTETHTAKEIEKELKTHIEKNRDTCVIWGGQGWSCMGQQKRGKPLMIWLMIDASLEDNGQK